MTDRSTPDPSVPSEGSSSAEDVAFARLSAADPARGSAEPDLSAVRAGVLAAAAEQGAPTRRRSMLLAAGAAAAVAVLAGGVVGGIAVGRVTAPDPAMMAAPAGNSPVIPLVALQNNRQGSPNGQQIVQGAPNADLAMGTRGGAPVAGGSDQAISAESKMSAPYGWWGNQIFVPGSDVSSESAGTASGYLMSAQGVDRRALAERLAAEFGVPGTPQADEWGNVTAGSMDGSAPSLWVGGDALAAWSYYNPANDPWRTCVYESKTSEPGVAVGGSAGGAGAVATPEPAPDATGNAGSSDASVTVTESSVAPDPGASDDPVPASASCDALPVPDRDRSERTARALLASIGVPADGVAWDVSESSPLLTVSATQLVDGMRSALTWSVTFAADGVYSAYGSAAGLQEYPGYPVVSPREAIERTADPRWRALAPTVVWSDTAQPMAGSDVKTADPAAPQAAPLKDGRPAVQVPLSTVTLSGGELGLAQYWQSDGTVLLLPAYTFEDGQGNTWSIIAVSESAVDFSTP